jgi:hypothetical protein
MENPRDLTDRESFGRMSRVDPMASESRDRLSELYHAALERPPEAGRAFVREVCGGDDALCQELESLLGYAPAASSFLETPAAGSQPRRPSINVVSPAGGWGPTP